MDAMVEQQESEEVTRTQNNSEQDSGIRKHEKKVLGMEKREIEPRLLLKSEWSEWFTAARSSHPAIVALACPLPWAGSGDYPPEN